MVYKQCRQNHACTQNEVEMNNAVFAKKTRFANGGGNSKEMPLWRWVQTLEVTGKVSWMLLLKRRRKKMEVAMNPSSMFYRRECRPRNECGGGYKKKGYLGLYRGLQARAVCTDDRRAARRRL